MVQVRKLVLAIAAASALTSGAVHALGLGEVSLQSALNQPLQAEIDLLQVRDLSAADVISRLASVEAFTQAGVDRQYFLTDLKFTPVIRPNGKSVIQVSSSKPIREPYLNFLVEVNWPNGRLLREYTLLLDPPLYTPQPVLVRAPVSAPVVTPVQVPPPLRTQAPTPRPVATAPAASSVAPAPAPAPAAPASSAASTYRTTASDTLWSVAQRVSGGSVHQAMLAIQDLNPDAFMDGNINLMKKGQVLRLPTAEQVQRRSAQEAIEQVAMQNQQWKSARRAPASATAARQLDATKRDSAVSAPAKTELPDNLRLVSADSGKATSGSDQGAESGGRALSDTLAITKESLDISSRENTELKERMADLQSQLEKVQRLVELKDAQLAKLQADLASQAEQVAPVAEPAIAAKPAVAEDEAKPVSAPAVPETPTEVKAEPVMAEPAVAEPAVPAVDSNTSAVLEPVAEPAPEPDYNYEAEPATPAVAPVVDPTPKSAPKPEAAKPAVAPAPVQAPASSQSFFDELLNNSTLSTALGGGALLLLLLALLALSRRNARREAAAQQALGDEVDSIEQAPAAQSFAEAAATFDAPADASEQGSDVLSEVDVFVAYGRFNQAAELLENAINDEPNRQDLRLRLMEVYAELGDRDGFNRQARELQEIGGVSQEIDLVKAKYPAMVLGAAAVASAAAAAAVDPLDDFNFDDLNLDDQLEAAPASVTVESEPELEISLADLEAELERDFAQAPEAAVPEVQAAEPEIMFDLEDLDLSLDLPEAASTPVTDTPESLVQFDIAPEVAVEAPVSDNFELDAAFDLDLSNELTDLAPEVSTELEPLTMVEPEPVAFEPTAEVDDFLADFALADELPVEAPQPEVETPEVSLSLPEDFDLSLIDEQTPAEAAGTQNFLAELDQVNAELNQLGAGIEGLSMSAEAPAVSSTGSFDEEDDDFDFLSGTDETATKLDLARAYVDMGDTEGARDILDEVINEGNDVQQKEARELLARLA